MESSFEADNKRIETLIKDYLVKITTDETGWDVLYQDPEDNRYWELTYPESELHGGGAPVLRHLSVVEAHDKYNI